MADGGYAALARRLAQWTTKGLLTALIFVAGLGFGREALRWWSGRDSRDLAGPLAPADGLGDPSRRQELLFGNSSWQIDAESLLGDHARAMAVLVERCRQSAAASPLPGEPLRPGETQFLHYLRSQSPVRSQTGSCLVYQLEGAFPMAVGLRACAGPETACGAGVPPAEAAGTAAPREKTRGEGAATGWRIGLPCGNLGDGDPAGSAALRPAHSAGGAVDVVRIPSSELCNNRGGRRTAGDPASRGQPAAGVDAGGRRREHDDFSGRGPDRRLAAIFRRLVFLTRLDRGRWLAAGWPGVALPLSAGRRAIAGIGGGRDRRGWPGGPDRAGDGQSAGG